MANQTGRQKLNASLLIALDRYPGAADRRLTGGREEDGNSHSERSDNATITMLIEPLPEKRLCTPRITGKA